MTIFGNPSLKFSVTHLCDFRMAQQRSGFSEFFGRHYKMTNIVIISDISHCKDHSLGPITTCDLFCWNHSHDLGGSRTVQCHERVLCLLGAITVIDEGAKISVLCLGVNLMVSMMEQWSTLKKILFIWKHIIQKEKALTHLLSTTIEEDKLKTLSSLIK